MRPEHTPFWIDTEFDTDRASDGQSRYGAYVRQHIGSFAECWDGTFEENLPVRFAAEAWRVATPPIMVPGYVRYHSRILSASLDYGYWGGSLVANIELITSWPRALAESASWMKPTGRGWWHDWPVDRLGGQHYRFPGDDDISRRPYLMAKASLCFTVPDDQLPHPPAPQRAELEVADRACESVAAAMIELNRAVGPIIRALEETVMRSPR